MKLTHIPANNKFLNKNKKEKRHTYNITYMFNKTSESTY